MCFGDGEEPFFGAVETKAAGGGKWVVFWCGRGEELLFYAERSVSFLKISNEEREMTYKFRHSWRPSTIQAKIDSTTMSCSAQRPMDDVW